MRILRLVIVVLLWCLVQRVAANHVLGGNITWDCLGGNNYLITLTIYKDCFGATAAPPTQTLFLFPNTGCTLPFSTQLGLTSVTEISDLCPSELANSSCNGGLTPGTQQVIYTGVVFLNAACTWTLSAPGVGDWNYFVNLNYSGLPNAYFQTTLDPTLGCNNSVDITSLQVRYYCMGDPVSQQITVNNPNGYTLTYSLASVLTAAGANAPYAAGYSATAPIPGIAISPTGLITFNAPMQFGNYVVGVLISMYDSNGNLVGTILESMAFVIRICVPFPTTFTAPGVLSVNPEAILISGTEVSVCAGNQICFNVEATNPNAARVIALTSDFTSVFPTGTFTQSGTNPAEGQCCVFTNENMIGDYLVTLQATDDACIFPGFDQLQVMVHILPNLQVSTTNALICAGSSVNVTATGASSFQWNVVSGDFTPGFTCASCGNQNITPDITTVIEVVANGATAACNYRDTLTVTVSMTGLSAVAQKETCNGNDGSIDLTVPSGSGNYSYAWTIPSNVQDPGGLDGGTYTVTVSDLSLPGCTGNLSVTVPSDPPPSGSITGNTTICQGQSAPITFSLTGTGPFNINMSPSGPATASNGTVFNVSPALTTTYTLNSITDSNVPSCTYNVPSSVTITVLPPVTAAFLPNAPICAGDALNLELDISQTGTYQVSYTINGAAQTPVNAQDGTVLSFVPTDDATYTVTNVQYTSAPVCANIQNNQTTVVVNDLPTVQFSGATTICNGDNAMLQLELTGTGPWEIFYTANGTPAGSFQTNNAVYNWPVSPASTTTYCITSITDLGVNCSQTVNLCQLVTVLAVPSVNFTGSTTICPGQNANLVLDLVSAPGIFNAVIEGTDANGTLVYNLTNLTDPYTLTVSPSLNTTYTLQTVAYSAYPGQCINSNAQQVVVDVAANINAVLIDTLCSTNGQTWQAVFQVTGGNPLTWTVQPANAGAGSFAGNIYTSAPVPTGGAATWTFSDADNCNPTSVSMGPYNCPIVTWSGSMSPDTLVVCGNAEALGAFLNDAILDGDDQQMFILHDQPGTVAGVIYATDCDDAGFNDADTPLAFGNGAGQIQWGVVYYISSVVGDDDGSGDCVNLNAPSVSVSAGQPVIFVQIPSVSFSGGGAACSGNSVVVQADFAGNTPWQLIYSIDGSTQPPVTISSPTLILNVNTSGFYLPVAVSTLGCTGSVSGNALVTIHPLPTATFDGNGATCIGTPYNFQINLTGTSDWNFTVAYDNGFVVSNTAVSGVQNSPYQFAASGQGTYTVTNLTDGNGCSAAVNSAQVSLTVHPLPTAQYLFGDTSFCSGSSLELQVALTGQSPWNLLYTVNNGAPQNWSAVTTPFYPTVNTGGLYTIVSVTDGNGCASLPGINIQVDELTVPVAAAGADGAICSGQSFQLGTPFQPGLTYLWSNVELLDDATLAEPTATITNNSTLDAAQIFTLTVSNAQCSAQDDAVIIVHPLPPVDAGAADSLCFGQTADLLATGAVNYLWSDNGLFVTALDVPAVQVAPLVNTYFFVQGWDQYGCTATDSVLVAVGAPLLSNLNFTNQMCFGWCNGTASINPSGGFTPYNVQWTNNIAGLQPTGLCPGTYDFTLTDAIGCSVQESFMISELAFNPIDQINITSPICFGETDGAIEVIDLSGNSFTLVPPSVTNTSGYFTNLGAGQYTVSMTDTNGCTTDSVVTFVSVSAIMNLQAGFNTLAVCYNQQVDFTATATGGSGSFTYYWYNCAEAIPGCLLGTGQTLTLPATSEMTVYCQALDANDCPSNVVSLSTYWATQIALSAGAPQSQVSICETECVNLQAGVGGGSGTISVTWIELAPQDSVVLSNSYTSYQCPMDDAVYLAVATDACSPPALDTVWVQVFEMPDAELSANNYHLCAPGTVFFENLTDAALTEECLWTLGDGNSLAICSGFSYIYATEGVYWPTLTVISSDGCMNTDTLNTPITIHGYPEVDFTWQPQPVTVLENTVEFISLSQGVQLYDWTFGVMGQSTAQNPLFTFPDIDLAQFEVCLTGINQWGCAATTCHVVTVESMPLVYVPNAFTPNYDGRNDYFLPSVRGFVPGTYRLSIFDRWGLQIFFTDDAQMPWLGNVMDGDYLAQNDVYVWQIEFRELETNTERIYRGHVSLLR